MRYLLLALLLVPLAAAGQFNVGLTVYGCSADFNSYEQLSLAQPNGSVVQLRVPINVTSNGTCPVTIPAQFRNATNFTAIENGTIKNTLRAGNTVSWNATKLPPSFLLFNASPPNVSAAATQTGVSYTLAITINSSTALRNSSYYFTVPVGYTNYRLTETLGSQVDRTLTYALAVNGTNASFTNVFFTANVMQRSLMLAASIPSTGPGGAASGGGAGGGVLPGRPSSDNNTTTKTLIYYLPDQISSVRGSSSTSAATVTNYGPEQYVTFSIEPAGSALKVEPNTMTVAAGATKSFTFKYSPGLDAQAESVKFIATSSSGERTQSTIRLMPVDKGGLTIDINPTSNNITVYGEAPNGDLQVFIRTDTGSVVRKVDVKVSDGRYSADLDIGSLPEGTYETCAVTLESGTKVERCNTLELRRPAFEQPEYGSGSQGFPKILWIAVYAAAVGCLAWLVWRIFWGD